MPYPSSGSVVESLEVRTHFAVGMTVPQYYQNAATTGCVVGVIYNDANGNGTRDLGERGAAGRRVYLDFNGNGRRDANEGYAVTDQDGVYRFRGLKAGRYFVKHLVPGQGTSPLYKTTCECTTDDRIVVQVTAGGTTRGADFGVRTVPLTSAFRK